MDGEDLARDESDLISEASVLEAGGAALGNFGDERGAVGKEVSVWVDDRVLVEGFSGTLELLLLVVGMVLVGAVFSSVSLVSPSAVSAFGS